MAQSKSLDFRGQEIFVGLDVHKRNWTVSIYSSSLEHKTFTQNPDPDLLVRYLRRNFPHASCRCVYEAGYCGFWICHALWERGVECIVVHPADVPTKDKERRRKTNRVDSRKLARELRNGTLEPVYVPDRQTLEDRSLLRTRAAAVKHQTQIMNRIKALLACYGIAIPERFGRGNWSGAFLRWLEQLPMHSNSGKVSLEFLLNDLKHCRQQIAHLNRQIRALAATERYGQQASNLTTIPGIGVLTAMILLVELVDINRFKSLDHLASYVGLVPGERSSGEDEHQTGITSRSHHSLRGILIECSWTAVRKDPALLVGYEELIRRMCAQNAIIRIARKLLNRIRYCLKNNQPYVQGVLA